MKASLLASTLEARFHAHLAGDMHRAALIEGPPGGGKTQIMGQVAKRLGVGFRMLHAPLMQPEDYGMPVVSASRDSVNFVVPTEKFPVEGADCPDRGILCLDEIPQADNAGQKILANLVQEREIHGKRLKPGWMIVGTGNRVTDRAGANRLLSHFRNRMTTYNLDTDLDDWANWYLAQSDCKVEVVACMRFRPSLLHDFNPQQDINPSPRAWVEGVGAALGNVPHEAEFETFKGDVGEGPAAEFTGFLRIYRSLPDPDAVLLDPTGSPVPTDAATQYALAGAIAQRATRDNFERVIAYAQRMPGEITVLVVLDSIRKDDQVTNTKAYLQWASGPGAQLLATR